jgi:hypothetical protein
MASKNPFTYVSKSLPLNDYRAKVPVAGISSKTEIFMISPLDPNDSFFLLNCLLKSTPNIMDVDTSLTWYCSLMKLVYPDIHTVLIPALNNLGYVLKLVSIDPKDTTQWLAEYPQVDPSTVYRYAMKEQDLAVHYGIIFQFIHKQLNDINFDGWLERRLRALNSKFSVDVVLTKNDFMDIEVIGRLCSKLQNNFEVRKVLFLSIVAITKSQGSVSQAAHITLNLMRFSNMSYLVIIDKYLISNKHPILYHGPLRNELKNLAAAYEFLNSQPEEDIPYIRILQDENYCMPLNRQKFTFLTIAARAIGSQYTPSLVNLNVTASSEQTKSMEDLAISVDKALNTANTVTEDDVSFSVLGIDKPSEHEKDLLKAAANRQVTNVVAPAARVVRL